MKIGDILTVGEVLRQFPSLSEQKICVSDVQGCLYAFKFAQNGLTDYLIKNSFDIRDEKVFFCNENQKWYFSNEIEESVGPYDTQYAAVEAFSQYLGYMTA